MPITRRDFLNGAALTIATGLTPAAQIAAQPERYPPGLTGLRGQYPGAFETAHALVREHKRFSFDGVPVEERYDLIVVGGGLSGLAAAYFYRRAADPQARILVLDNHDDFGGHAKRNEFTLDGRLVIGYGGSQSMQGPRTLYSAVAKRLLRDLHVDVSRFQTAFDRNLYSSLGLSHGVFFAREAFGRDALVAGDPMRMGTGEIERGELISAFPISADSKAQLLALYTGMRDPLAGKSVKDKLKILKTTSYRDYLVKICGCSEEVANCFQGRTQAYFALGCDAVPAADVLDSGYPGFQGLRLPNQGGRESEPYIYHFPDGNASLARLLVRALVPAIAPGRTMEDIVLAPFEYARLDASGQNVRIRLDSTCVDVRNVRDKVMLGYVREGAPHRVEAKHVVLACHHSMIPYIMPELKTTQREALEQCVRAPLVYTNVLIRNWQSFVNLKVNSISAPMSFHSMVQLDFPVDLGGYHNPRNPAEPMCLHLAHVPGAPNRGLTARQQFRIGRAMLLEMTFADFEDRIRDELDRMLGAGGFSSAREIAAITVNRWPHGYSYTANSLFDEDDYDDVVELARQKSGRVAIANSDAGGDAYAHIAIDQADRAVRELLG